MRNLVILLITFCGFWQSAVAQYTNACGQNVAPNLRIRTGNDATMSFELAPSLGTTFTSNAGLGGQPHQFYDTPIEDPNFFIHSANGGCFTPNVGNHAYIVPRHTGFNSSSVVWGDFSTSDWISAKNDNQNCPAPNTGPPTPYVYSFPFKLTSSSSSSPNLHLEILSDDQLEVFLNYDPNVPWTGGGANPHLLYATNNNPNQATYTIQNRYFITVENPNLFVHGTNKTNVLYFRVINQERVTGINITGTLSSQDINASINDERCESGNLVVPFTVSSGSLASGAGVPYNTCLNGFQVNLLQGSTPDNLTAAAPGQVISGTVPGANFGGTFDVSGLGLGAIAGNLYIQLVDPQGNVVSTRRLNYNFPAVPQPFGYSLTILSDDRCNDGSVTFSYNVNGGLTGTNPDLYDLVVDVDGVSQTVVLGGSVGLATSGTFTINPVTQGTFYVHSDFVLRSTQQSVCAGAPLFFPAKNCCPGVVANLISDNRCVDGTMDFTYLVDGTANNVNLDNYELSVFVNGQVQTVPLTGSVNQQVSGNFTITPNTFAAFNASVTVVDLNTGLTPCENSSPLVYGPANCCPLIFPPVKTDTRCADGKVTLDVGLNGLFGGIINLSLFEIHVFENGQLIATHPIPSSGAGFYNASIPLQRSGPGGFSVQIKLVDPNSGEVVCDPEIFASFLPAWCCPGVTGTVLADDRCSGGGLTMQYTLTDQSFFGDLSVFNGTDLDIFGASISALHSEFLNGLSGPTYTSTFTVSGIHVDLNAQIFTTNIYNEGGQNCLGQISTPPAYCCPTIALSLINDFRCDGGGVAVQYDVTHVGALDQYSLAFNNGYNVTLTGLATNTTGILNIPLGQDDALTLNADFIHPDGTNISQTQGCLFDLEIIEACCGCVGSFAPMAGKKYVLGAWVKEEIPVSSTPIFDYEQGAIEVGFIGAPHPPIIAKGEGAIIDGWQRIEVVFDVPAGATEIKITLKAPGSHNVYFDDIRVHPFDASMSSYVYDPVTFRLTAILDDRNFATFYEYDEDGQLRRVKKETERGVLTTEEYRINTYKGVKAQ